MKSLSKAMVASLIATVALSIAFVMKSALGIMPELDMPRMLATMMGMPNVLAVGWAAHFFIGVVVYGGALALLDEHLPGPNHVWHGVLLALGGWLIMMVVFMPMAGAGFFGMNLGIGAPLMTLVLHVMFGAILGGYYGYALRNAAPARSLA